MAGITKWLRLRDGRDYLLRELTPDDTNRLFEFFYTHTEETIYRRYGHIFRNMSHNRARQLVSVDQRRDLALAVFDTVLGRDLIRGIGRYYLDPDGTSAEVAFVVSEKTRRIGMSRALLETMAEAARQRGLLRLWAYVLEDNVAMLQLFRKAGARIAPVPEDGQVEVVMQLGAAAPAAEEESGSAGSLTGPGAGN